MKSAARTLLRRCRAGVDRFRHLVRWYEPEDKIAREAQAWWDAPPEDRKHLYAHWRAGFEEPEAWLAVGRENFDLFTTFARSAQLSLPLQRMVEWGCGGGANAVHFGRLVGEFYGVDITSASLDECRKQMGEAGLTNFRPVLIGAESPEAALGQVPAGCDLFLCVYVFELLPTPEYGLRVLRIAAQLLRSGGMALVQIKYTTDANTRPRRWGYRFGVSNMTTYRLDEFWESAKACGFRPHAVYLVPKQPLVHDERYAYFVLIRE